MFCAKCGAPAPDGARFCQNCGAPLTIQGGVTHQQYPQPLTQAALPVPVPPKQVRRAGARQAGSQNPYRQRITELRLQIKQLKLYLKQANQQMSSTRLGYYESSMFVPSGLMRMGYKLFEDWRLLGPQQQKQRLQQQIMQLEQELLGLQQAQEQWRQQQQP